jgi:ribosomal protein S6 kinase alpha-1/2/3/6
LDNFCYVVMIAGVGPNGIADIKAHPFFATINFDKLVKRQLMPPYKPVVSRMDDTFYFDSEFTSRTPRGLLLIELNVCC